MSLNVAENVQPVSKEDGETLVKDINAELKLYIMKELNVENPSGER